MDDTPPINIKGKLIQTLMIKEIGEIAQEYSELGLDLITDEKILRNIPIVGTLVKLNRATISVRDRLYLAKIIRFLKHVGETTQQQREKFIEDNCQNAKQFEEAVLLILEQSDNMEKSSLIGKIFKACILKIISYKDAIMLSEITNRSFWGDLEVMFNLRENKHQAQRLFQTGLFEMEENIGWKEIGKLKVKQNEYALALQEIYREHYDNLNKCQLGIVAKNNDSP